MKRYLALILAALLLLSFAACTTNETPAPEADPTEAAAAPTQGPTEVPTEAPTEAPTEQPEETPDPDVFVPAGYDAHDYLALAKLFSAPIDEYGGVFGDYCFIGEYEGRFDVKDPSTWGDNYNGVKWDAATGKCTEFSLHPFVSKAHAALDLSGFEMLQKVAIWDVTFDSIDISDCPMLKDGCMIYTGAALGDAHVEAGYVGQLQVVSHTRVYCSLMGDEHPFVLDLKAEGDGRVKASGVFYEGEYKVCGVAMEDQYIDFLGWYDEAGNLVSNEKFLYLSGEELGKIEGEHHYIAKFSAPAAPTPLPEGDFFCELKPNVPSKIDIDGDGEPDTVLVSVKEYDEEEENDDLISVTVTLAASPDEPYHFNVDNEGGFVTAAAVDFDPDDKHIEIVVTYDMCDGDPSTHIYRLKDDGSGFDEFVEYVEVIMENDGNFISWYFNGVPEGYKFSAKDGLCFARRTEILGTNFVLSRFTVTKDGFEMLDPEYHYWPDLEALKLKRELTVTLENGKTKTLPKGAKIVAYSTDRETYVKVKLEDGSIGRIKVTFGKPKEHYPVLLNGVDQDEYAEIGYAD